MSMSLVREKRDAQKKTKMPEKMVFIGAYVWPFN